MKASAPIVSMLKAPLENSDFNIWVLRNTHVVPQLNKVIANASQTSLEVLRFVLVIVTAKDVEIISREIDHFLAPIHIIGPFLSACHDSRVRSNCAQPTAIDINNFRVLLRSKAIIHRLVVDLKESHTVRIRM